MKKSIFTIGLVLAIIAAIAFTLVKNKKTIETNKQVVDRSGVAIAVSTYPVQSLPVTGSFSSPAVLQANADAEVSATVQGKITSLNIELGSMVSKGQVIGRVDTRLKELSVKSTQLSIEKLEKDYQRYKELLEGNATTEVNVNDIKFNYENTKMQLEQLQQQISEASITAPISGIVTVKNLQSGEFVNPGTPIATIVDVSRLKATLMVNEKDVYKIKQNMPAQVSSDVFPGEEFRGTVSFISPVGDDNHNYRVEVLLGNAGKSQLKAGTYVNVSFDLGTRGEALQIPKIALVEGMTNPYVYIIEGSTARSRKVTLGRELGENVEVISGLQPGEQVVTSGQINLAEGTKVEVLKK